MEIFYLIDRKRTLELEKFTFRPGGTRMVEWARMGELRSKPWRRVDLKGSAKQKRAAGAVWAPGGGVGRGGVRGAAVGVHTGRDAGAGTAERGEAVDFVLYAAVGKVDGGGVEGAAPGGGGGGTADSDREPDEAAARSCCGR